MALHLHQSINPIPTTEQKTADFLWLLDVLVYEPDRLVVHVDEPDLIYLPHASFTICK